MYFSSTPVRLSALAIAVHLATVALLSSPLLFSTAVNAQTLTQAQMNQQEQVNFVIAAGSLSNVLNQYAEQAGMYLTANAELTNNKNSAGLTGNYTRDQVLAKILQDTGISFNFKGKTITLSRDKSKVMTLATTKVSDSTSGSKTEGTNSYAPSMVSVGSKVLTNPRYVPKSITVLSRKRIEDENLTTLQEALDRVTGVDFLPSSQTGERGSIAIRGFSADVLKVDGVNVGRNNDGVNLFDLAIYDRIEIQRGPAGIFQGSAEPGGTANLVRKRATNDFGMSAMMNIGSFGRQRAEIDITSSMVESGKVNGRAVVVYDERDSFVDFVESKRFLAFGTMDFDISNQTMLTIGSTVQNGSGRDSRGLPTFDDGSFLDVSRSTFLGADWNNHDSKTAEIFSTLQHSFNNGVDLNLSGTYLDREASFKYAYADRAADATTGDVKLRIDDVTNSKEEVSLDGFVSIPMEAMGQTQEFVIGADYYSSDYDTQLGRIKDGTLNVFDLVNSIAEPDLPLSQKRNIELTQYGIYGQATIKPVSWARLIIGGRMTWWDNETIVDRMPGVTKSSTSIDNKFTPSLAGLVDVSNHQTLYGSWSSIFVPQEEVKSDGSVVQSRIGEQYEIGLNGKYLNDNIFTHFALFHIVDDNRATEDPNDEDFSVAGGKVRAQGFEAEINGELMASWNLSAGYSYLHTEYLDDPENEGSDFQPRSPNHTLRLSTNYVIRDGRFRGVGFGSTAQAYSGFYNDSRGARIEQSSYVIADLHASYQISENLMITGTLSNIFDKEYYQSLESVKRQNYLGEPRAFMLTMRGSW